MGSINLATGGQNSMDNAIPYKAGIISIVATAAVLGLAYWGMVAYGKNIDEKKAIADAAYREQETILTGNKNRDIVDFQNRIIVARALVGEQFFSIESLAALEKSIVPGAWLTSYDYDKKTGEVGLNCSADNFNIMAKQILAFKNSDFFSDVSLENSGLDQDGKANFFVTLKIKN